MAMIHVCITLATMLTLALAEYSCVCNYDVEHKVLAGPDLAANLVGYMYEFDCKKTADQKSQDPKFTTIEFQHKLGYVAVGANLQEQTCPGDPPASDLIPTTTPTTTTTTTTTTTATTSLQTSAAITTKTKQSTSIPSSQVMSSTNQIPTSANPTTKMSSSTTQMPTTKSPATSQRMATSTTSSPTSPPMTASTSMSSSSQTPSMSTSQMVQQSTQIPSSAPTTVKPATNLIMSTTPMSTAEETTPEATTEFTVSTSTPISMETSTMTSHAPHVTSTLSSTPLPTSKLMSSSTPGMATSTTIATSPPTTTIGSTTTTAPQFAPLQNLESSNNPLKFLGVGYNLLDGNPGAMDVTSYGSGHGLMVFKRIFQLTKTSNMTDGTAREAEMNKTSSCVKKSYSRFIHDGKSYRDDLATFVNYGATSPMLSNEAFTFNTEFDRVRQATEGTSSTVYRDTTSTCKYGSVRYHDDLANSAHFSISRDFATDVCKLPAVFDATPYLTFIDKWGTDIVMALDIGTMTVERYKTTGQQTLAQIQKAGYDWLIYPSKGSHGYGSSVSLNSTGINSAPVGKFGVRMATKIVGATDSLSPTHITITPITEALKLKYWTQVLEGALFSDVCSGNISESVLGQKSTNINTALMRYVAYRRSKAPNTKPLTDRPITIPMVWPYGSYGLIQAASGCPAGEVPWRDNHPITIPMVWPYGSYGLMQATLGCPAGKVPWGDGYRKFDTEDSNSHNYFSDNVAQYLAGDFSSNNIITKFCMKTTASIEAKYDRAWPAGSYCILKRGGCPLGFRSGFVYWDDQDISNSNDKGGQVPDGTYNSNTKIYYCCRNDGTVSKPILLPRERPFVFLRHKTACQTVYGMEMHEIVVRWDDEDIFNSDDVSGAHPYDDGGDKDHKLHFCHYREQLAGLQPGLIG